MKYISLIVISLLFFTGCGPSGYSKYYKSRLPENIISTVSTNPNFITLKNGEEPKVLYAYNLDKDLDRLEAEGYVILGWSSFNGREESIDNAIDQAKKVGALLVLVNSAKYTDTMNTSGAYTMPNTTTTNYTGNVGSAYYSGTATTQGSTIVPYSVSVRRYDQGAVYFIKDNYPVYLGTRNSSEITREERIRIGYTGIRVNIILKDSPIYLSNVLKGDIILAIDRERIESYEHYNKLTQKYNDFKGTSILTIYRNGKVLDIPVKF